jgi:PIN domain nuclease of toxin-antitoxin system
MQTMFNVHEAKADFSNILAKAVGLSETHRDPADRFIIASALLNGLSVVTTDRRFHEYGVNVIS